MGALGMNHVVSLVEVDLLKDPRCLLPSIAIEYHYYWLRNPILLELLEKVLVALIVWLRGVVDPHRLWTLQDYQYHLVMMD